MKHPTKDWGDLYFFHLSGRELDEYNAIVKDAEALGVFEMQAKLLIVMAKTENRQKRFSDADFDKILDAPGNVIQEAALVGQAETGIGTDDTDDVKKK